MAFLFRRKKVPKLPGLSPQSAEDWQKKMKELDANIQQNLMESQKRLEEAAARLANTSNRVASLGHGVQAQPPKKIKKAPTKEQLDAAQQDLIAILREEKNAEGE